MMILHTSRLKLRSLRVEDAPSITRGIGNFKVCKNLARVPYPYTEADALDFLDWISMFDHRSLVCGIELPHTGELIGVISYLYEVEQDQCELGYWLAEAHWGQGYGKEAAKAMVTHAFTANSHEGLISAFHDDNPASGRILQGLGFQITGHEPALSRAQDRIVPSTQLQLTKAEFLLRHAG
ncbi:MAG: GNAT family N-acetyltransferase [Alphaproteobacteria bacterium]|nr:GNAT family N-acetyltransferase [Alphaproteobacteria bacterium]